MEARGEVKGLNLEIAADTFRMQTADKQQLLEVRLHSNGTLEGDLLDYEDEAEFGVKEIWIHLRNSKLPIGAVSDYVAKVSEAAKQDRTEVFREVLRASELFPFSWLKTDGVCVILQGIESKYKFSLGGGLTTDLLQVTLTWQGTIQAKTWQKEYQKNAVEIDVNCILVQQQSDQLVSMGNICEASNLTTRKPQHLSELGTKEKFDTLSAAEKSSGHIGVFKNWRFESITLQY